MKSVAVRPNDTTAACGIQRFAIKIALQRPEKGL
jgi:hypothetical protein